jgi:hypothetical protein
MIRRYANCDRNFVLVAARFQAALQRGIPRISRPVLAWSDGTDAVPPMKNERRRCDAGSRQGACFLTLRILQTIPTTRSVFPCQVRLIQDETCEHNLWLPFRSASRRNAPLWSTFPAKPYRRRANKKNHATTVLLRSNRQIVCQPVQSPDRAS